MEFNQIDDHLIIELLCLPSTLVSLLGSDIFVDDFIDDSDGSDVLESDEDNDDEENTFMQSYSDAMNEQLKATTLQKSFVRAKEQIPKKDEVFCLSLHE